MVQGSDGVNVQIREIAERAGVAIGTAYRYFGSKDRLLAEVHAQWSAQRREVYRRLLAEGASNLERLRAIALAIFDNHLDQPHHTIIGRELRASGDPDVLLIMHEVEQAMRDLFRSALVGIEQRDADSIAMIVSSVIDSVMERNAWELVDVNEARRQIAKAVRTVLEFRDPTVADPPPTRTRAAG